MPPLCVSQWCHWHRCATNFFGISSRIIRHTVFLQGNLTLLHTAQWCHWHHCDFGPHIQEALATFKGTIYRKNILRQIVLHYTYNFHTKNRGVKQRLFFVTAVRRFHSRFSSRIQSHIRKGFNPCIRGLGVGVDKWKKTEVKILVSGSL
jgi:hypothetical protein